MGHNSDKLYITHREHAGEFGEHAASSAGAKAKRGGDGANFARLPFDCCALSLKPFEMPVCTPEGTTYDLVNIIPYIRKYHRDPVSGEKLETKDLVKLNFAKNAEDSYFDPVTYKVFTEHTPIVAIRSTGNVFSRETIDRLNIKAGHWQDLVTDEKFKRSDIITLQDPHNVDRKDLSRFEHIKKNLKVTDEEAAAAAKDPLSGFNLNATGGAVAAVLKKMAADKAASTPKPVTIAPQPKPPLVTESPVAGSSTTTSSSSKGPTPYNASKASTGRVGASLTSTAYTPVTNTEIEMIDEEDFMFERIVDKGYVRITTNLGALSIELFCDKAPRTCYNFLMLARNRYYDGTVWHRLIPGFMLQGGDPTGTGKGGESFWGKPFGDETHLRGALKHDARGLLSMANHGKDTNGSQFFITFRENLTHLNNKHTVFGRVVGGETILTKLESVPVDPSTDRPLRPLSIEDVTIFDDPFEKYKQRLSKKLEREMKEFNANNKKISDQIERQRDRVTWFGTKLDDTLNSNETTVTNSQGIGKYLSTTTKRKESGQLIDVLDQQVGVEPIKKKKKGFGDFSSW